MRTHPHLVRATVLAAALLGSSASPALARADDPAAVGDVADLARKAADPLIQAIWEAAPRGLGRPPRVVVLDIGDREGRVTPLVAESAMALRGELTRVLREQGDGRRMTVRSPGAVRQDLIDQGRDPAKFGAGGTDEAQELVKLGVADVAILGRFEAISAKGVQEGLTGEVEVRFQVISNGGEPREVKVAGPPQVLVSPAALGRPSGRFDVELLVDGKVIPLQRIGRDDPEYANVLVAELDPGQVNANRSAKFQLRLKNKGSPQVVWGNPHDEERLYGAAVIVDGVSAVLEPSQSMSGEVIYNFVETSPVNAKKFVLCGPRQRVRAAQGESGYELEPAGSGTDGSVVAIGGFQQGNEVARQFVFAPYGSCSVAQRAGVAPTAVGMIDVHFFPQALDGDRSLQRTAGIAVAAGAPIEQRTFEIKFEVHPDPVESWRIRYYVKQPDAPPPLPVAR